MSIPRDFIELLLARIDLVDLIHTHVPLRKKSASNYFARCPFHQEKSASFSVSQTKQFYYCFGCGAHGNAIDFMMQHERLNFPEAVETLAKQQGMEVPQTTQHHYKKDDALPALYAMIDQACHYYYEKMCKSPAAIHYLKQRGITGVVAQQFTIGFAPPGWQHLLDALGKTETDKKKLYDVGLIIKKNEGGYYDRFRERIMFPIHDVRGRIIGFGGRVLDQGEPKYLNSPETTLFQKGQELYGLFHALRVNRQLERVLIVEGYMDVIALFQYGITYAVATLGTATTKEHLQRLSRYSNDIIFCFDGDTAGRTAAWRALQVIFPLMNDNLQIRFLFLPDGEDPDSLIRKEGKHNFEKRILDATSLAHFFFQRIATQSDLTTLEGRARFASLALKEIKQITTPLFQGMLIEELSKRTRIDLHELKQQIKSSTQPSVPAATKPAQTLTLVPPLRLAIALLLQYPKMIAYLDEHGSLGNHIAGISLLTELATYIRAQPTLTTGILIERFRDKPEADLIHQLALWEHLIPNAGRIKAFKHALQQLTVINLKTSIDSLLAKAAQEGLSDSEKIELTRLINQKNSLTTV